jgi:hypothetical protein
MKQGFKKALVPFRKDMRKILKRRKQSEQVYLNVIYTSVTTPHIWAFLYDKPAWVAERYLMDHYKEEFVAWLRIQL